MSNRRSLAINDASHISQAVSDGWFSNVHLGQRKVDEPAILLDEILQLWTEALSGVEGILDACLLLSAAIAALTTWSSGGFIPHARHGGSGVCAFTAEGSKLEGTGFENEHIGQTHVALSAAEGAGEAVTDRNGVA